MSAKLLLIHQNAEFLKESLITSLKNRDVTVADVSPTIEQIGREREDTDIFLILAADYVKNIHYVLDDLRRFCETEEKPLFVVGYDKDFALVEEVIPPSLIACRITRPFDMRQLAELVMRFSSAENTKGRKRSILLVDDDTVFLKTMIKFLGDTYDVTAVRAGKQALKYLEAHTVDLILLDYEMPMMSGPETLTRIREKQGENEIPVIFLTGISDRESVVTVMQMKPDGYMLKNSGKEELLGFLKIFFISYKWKKIREK